MLIISHIKMSITQQIFDNESWKQFCESPSKSFYSKEKTNKNCFEGNLVLLQNTESCEIMGIAKLGKFAEGTTIRERYLLNEDQYKGSSAKWNHKYEIAIQSVKLLAKPISFSDFAFLFDIEYSKPNNICKPHHFNSRRLFCKSDSEEIILKKIHIWAESLI